MKVTAIVAAFNEEKTIGGVLASLTSSSSIDEVIVVSDGSSDRTVEIARSFDVSVIALRRNRGKGNAMRLAVNHATGDVLFFVDADMMNLSEGHIRDLVKPVTDGTCDMNVGVRHRGPILDFFHLQLHFGPVISGIRAMRREVWRAVPSIYKDRFKIELALNYFCRLAGLKDRYTVIHDLGHVKKESKRGFRRGFSARFEMTKEVILLHFDLYFFHTWRWTLRREGLMPIHEHDFFDAEFLD